MTKIAIPEVIETKEDIDTVIQSIHSLWQACHNIKKFFPSVWTAISWQYQFDTRWDKKISEELFDRKIEILLLQDQELRKK